jgi:hypothetical protein
VELHQIPSRINTGTPKPDVIAVERLLYEALGHAPVESTGALDYQFRHLVRQFQLLAKLKDDGIFGPQTAGALRNFLGQRRNNEGYTYDAPSWLIDRAWQFAEYAKKNVVYGPGRGLFSASEDGWRFTIGAFPPEKSFSSVKGACTQLSAHCSSLTNMFLGFITNANEKYTPTGNMPIVWDTYLDSFHVSNKYIYNEKGQFVQYRGYGEWCRRLVPTEEACVNPKHKYLRYALSGATLYDMLDTLPDICMIAIGFFNKKSGYVFKHTAILLTREEPEGRALYYLGADGSKDARKRYSAGKVKLRKITETSARKDPNVYQVFLFDPTDINQADAKVLLP